MKLKTIISAAASLAILFSASNSFAQIPIGGGPGIAVAGSQEYSQLPEKATKFIDKHFKDVGIRKCEKYFAKSKYEVELRNGVDIEFDSKGNVIEIDSPDRTVLPAEVVKDVIPHKAYERLVKDGYTSMVESIDFNRGKVYEVELSIPGPDTYVFDLNGVFLAIED